MKAWRCAHISKIIYVGLKMDDHKVRAILDWEPPKLVLTLGSFLILAFYYHKFIKNFVKIATLDKPFEEVIRNL